ncbi:DNA polymerase I [Rhodoluna lacicola]|uniref:DNA polymerase I n=1 Tax=Rhodoluna lacicola TaxID=529884 RepID=UPI00222E4786|nr:DNA polymerase I [Rhodoluna lacicola]BDS50468.1 DNA polymerase [Rhodoluna lacicola]
MNANPKPTLLLIDGHSLAFRAFYALNPDNFKTKDGQHTNAVHGFISMLLNILQAEKPTHLAVAFDLSRGSFRTQEYPEYKGTRGETPPEFIGQTELLQEALAAMNIKTITRENFEADDILASLADQSADKGFSVFVVSGDRDTFQLISDNTTILYPIKGVMNLARMDDAAVLEKYGIHARQYPDLAALVGETSDNLPGIPGVGPKTAAKWLQQFGDLNAVLDAADSITGKVGENLREHRELAVRNRRLNHLIRDLEFEFDQSALELGGVDEDAVRQVFAKLEFKTLTERVLRLRGSKPKDNTDGAVKAFEDAFETSKTDAIFEELQIPSAEKLTSAKLTDWLKSVSGTVGLSFEISEQNITAVGFATESVRKYWEPNSSQELKKIIEPWLKDPACIKAIHGAKDFSKLLFDLEIEFAGLDYDTLLLAYLLNPVRKDFTLDELALEYLGTVVKRGDPNQLIAEETTDVSLDAWLTISLAPKLYEQVKDQEQLHVYAQVELPTNLSLARMEHFGISVDVKKLNELFERLTGEVATIAKSAYEIIGHEINLASPKQLQTVLFDELGMTGTKQVKTGFSTNAAALTELYEQTEHPFLARLLEHREVTKIRQIVETMLKAVAQDGRIHTNYVQTGTSTGRLSSENPNLQNIPIRSQRGREIRDAFVAGQGFETLLSADYSQIEMRIMAHLSEDSGIIEAFKTGEDLHRFVGSRLFGVEPQDVTTSMRGTVKAMSYGLVYGLSEYGLAKQLRISNAEAKQLMADYFARFGGVKRYLASVVDEAKTKGFTVTTFGRRRPFDDLNSKIFQVRENARRAALNAPIQGTAADIMKLAMNAIDQKMQESGLKSRMLLQVHDELVFEVAKGELDTLKDLVTKQMEQVVELSVPLEVQIGIGKSWDQAAH